MRNLAEPSPRKFAFENFCSPTEHEKRAFFLGLICMYICMFVFIYECLHVYVFASVRAGGRACMHESLVSCLSVSPCVRT